MCYINVGISLSSSCLKSCNIANIVAYRSTGNYCYLSSFGHVCRSYTAEIRSFLIFKIQCLHIVHFQVAQYLNKFHIRIFRCHTRNSILHLRENAENQIVTVVTHRANRIFVLAGFRLQHFNLITKSFSAILKACVTGINRAIISQFLRRNHCSFERRLCCAGFFRRTGCRTACATRQQRKR